MRFRSRVYSSEIEWFQSYVVKFRNLSFLEHQLEDLNRTEQDQLEVGMNHHGRHP